MATATSSLSTSARPPVRSLRLGGLGLRLNLRVLVLVVVTLAALAALAAWAMMLGSFRLPLADVTQALFGRGTSAADFIVLDLRLPRVLAAVAVGAMLALSGAVFQGLVRNPLVSPDIIGINAGASLGAVYWIVNQKPDAWLPAVAFGGALVAAFFVYALTWRGRISGSRLILVGIGVNALLSALITLLIVRANTYEVSEAYQWMTGSVYTTTWPAVWRLLIALAVLLPLGGGLMWSLRVMQMGDLAARSVGLPLERTRLALVVVGCALSASAVSAAGPVAFVSLMIPHFARMVAGPMTGGVFILSAGLGALLLLGADMVGQHALPIALPVGVLTGALGAPYFLFLLYRANTRL